jgi:hypothetical protein
MAYVGKNPRFDSEILTDQTSSSVDSPASGSHKVVNRNGKLFMKNSAGGESEVGSGTGELNVVLNASDANAVWTASGAGVTVATTTTSSDLPLSGIFSTAIKITPVSGTDYVRYRFTMPESFKNRKLKIQWEQRPLSGYASGDFKVEMYKNSASDYSGSYTEFPLSTDASGTSAVNNYTGRFVTTFDTDSGDYYELRIVRTAGTTALNIAGVIVGPGIQPQGAVVTNLGKDPFDLTYSAGFGSTSSRSTEAIRMGNRLKVTGNVTTGTVGATIASIILPSGYTIDATQYTSTANCQRVGFIRRLVSGSTVYGANIPLELYFDGSTTDRIFLCNTMGSNAYTQEAGNVILASSQRMNFDFEIPIAEWAGSGTINIAQNDIEYAYNTSGITTAGASNTTAFGYGPSGVAIGSIASTTGSNSQTMFRCQFLTPIQATDLITVEIASSGSDTWIPVTEKLGPFVKQGQSIYGVQVDRVSGSSTQVDVFFGNKGIAPANATYAGDGQAWSVVATSLWRVRKIKGGNAVGFGAAADGFLGLIKYQTGSHSSTFTFNGSGGTSSSATLLIKKVDNLVYLTFPSITATSGTGSLVFTSNTALPSWARPASTQSAYCVPIRNNSASATQIGYLEISTAGVMNIYRSLPGDLAWSNAVSCGTAARFTAVYDIS